MEGYPIVLGNYEFIAPIAEGGFGQVYLARMGGAAGFSRTVAVKRIRPEYTATDSFVSDFIKEARIGGMLTHHNVVQVLGFEEIQGQYFLIMEYVDGVGLDYVIRFTRKRGETLPLSVVAEIVAQTAEGLHYVHSLKHEDGTSLRLVHRDLKPSNIMISRLGVVKITDFGVARAAIEVGMKTQAGLIKGTLAYLSPEQARDEELDNRSDLYALGAILYELLTLRRLFPNESAFTTLEALGHNEVDEPLSKLPPEAEVFRPLLAGLLTERPEDRIATGGEVARQARDIQLSLTTATVSLAPFAERWIEARQAELTLRRIGKAGPPRPERAGKQPSGASLDDPVAQLAASASNERRPSPDQRHADREQLVEGKPTVLVEKSAQAGADEKGTAGPPRAPVERTARGDGASTDAVSRQPNRRRVALVAGAAGVLVALLAWFVFFGHRETPPRQTASLNTVPATTAPRGLAAHPSPTIKPETPRPERPQAAAAKPDTAPGPAEHATRRLPPDKKATVRSRHTDTVSPAAGQSAQASPRQEPSTSSKPVPAQARHEGSSHTSTSQGSKPDTVASKTETHPDNVAQPSIPVPPPPKAVTPPPKAVTAKPKAVATLPPGRLTVTSIPSAIVYLDGKSIGESPLKGFEARPGTHTLRLSRPDLEFHQKTQVTIEAGKDVRVTCTRSGCDVLTP